MGPGATASSPPTLLISPDFAPGSAEGRSASPRAEASPDLSEKKTRRPPPPIWGLGIFSPYFSVCFLYCQVFTKRSTHKILLHNQKEPALAPCNSLDNLEGFRLSEKVNLEKLQTV